MKANEAPEKIILSADRDTQIINDESVINNYTDNIKIEYIRTDAFIEKACSWLKSKGGFTIGFPGAEIKDFKNYMKEE